MAVCQHSPLTQLSNRINYKSITKVLQRYEKKYFLGRLYSQK